MAGWFDSNSGLSLVHICPTCNEITYDEKCGCGDHLKHSEIDLMRQTNDFLDCLMRSVECTVWTANRTKFRLTANTHDVVAWVDPTTTAIHVPCVVMGHISAACCAIVFERRFDTGNITHVIMAEGETKQFVSTNKPVLVSKVFVGDDRLVYSL